MQRVELGVFVHVSSHIQLLGDWILVYISLVFVLVSLCNLMQSLARAKKGLLARAIFRIHLPCSAVRQFLIHCQQKILPVV